MLKIALSESFLFFTGTDKFEEGKGWRELVASLISATRIKSKVSVLKKKADREKPVCARWGNDAPPPIHLRLHHHRNEESFHENPHTAASAGPNSLPMEDLTFNRLIREYLPGSAKHPPFSMKKHLVWYYFRYGILFGIIFDRRYGILQVWLRWKQAFPRLLQII